MPIRFTHFASVGAAIALLLSSQQASAQTSERCPDLCGDWEVGAHALYFTPITCPYAYATSFVQTPLPNQTTSGRAQLIPCRADWGFRVFGGYLDGCLFARLSYQWFEVATSRSVVGNNVIIQGGTAVANVPGRATGQVRIEYQNVDGRLGAYLWQGCRSALYLYGNARWIDLSQRRRTRIGFANGNFQDAREKSELEGGALGIGFGGEFDVWCDIGAFVDGNLLGVIAERSLKDVRFRSLTGATLALVQQQESYPSETCVIPEVDFRIGLNYTYVCGCLEIVGEVGYEVDYFWHGSVFPDLTGSTLVNSTRDFALVCEDIGFSGLFFGCRLIF